MGRPRGVVSNLAVAEPWAPPVGTGENPFSVRYTQDAEGLERDANAGRFVGTTRISAAADGDTRERHELSDPGAQWSLREMRGHRSVARSVSTASPIRIVDLFCGCGGFSVGVRNAATAVGLRSKVVFAADVDAAPLRVYRRNLRPLRSAQSNVETLLDYTLPPRGTEEDFRPESAYITHELAVLRDTVDILIAGPPCQGNSNLNNRTRRVDPRNDLYFDAVISGIAIRAKVIAIENVPAVTQARQDVVTRSIRLLESAGYRTLDSARVLTASDYGTPQTRRRHFLIAALEGRHMASASFESCRVGAISAGRALLDFLDFQPSATTFDRPSALSKENERRVRYLLDRNEYDLPDEERPDCHRTKAHNYGSIYGRIHPDEPAPTITTGFLSPGRGRFTHPFLPRSLTPREGARLQGFGDDFDWHPPGHTLTRSDYAQMIGSAVPPQLGFVVGMAALSLL